MLCSIDGRIQTDRWKEPASFPQYESTGKQEKAQAWMCGRVTMELHFATATPELAPTDVAVDRTDHVADAKATSFAVAIDASGKLGWGGGEIDGDHVITVLTEQVPDAYLAYLKEQGVSYVFGGRQELDLTMVLEKLGSLFGIEKVLLEGGGKINGAFHAAGLIDAYSILYYPVADGSATPTVIDTAPEAVSSLPVAHLQLDSVEQLAGQVVWMKYTVKK
jgi:riboflavin biosynthesis pyrimidine reductase